MHSTSSDALLLYRKSPNSSSVIAGGHSSSIERLKECRLTPYLAPLRRMEAKAQPKKGLTKKLTLSSTLGMKRL